MTGAELLPLIKARSKGERYSENFMKWTRKQRNEQLEVVFIHWNNIDGSRVEIVEGTTQPQQILIGRKDGDGWFYGTRLSEILCKGLSAERYAFPSKHDFTSLPEWFDGYIQGGKCFIDPEHRWYYDRERWQVSDNGEVRECLWCGEYRQRKVVKTRTVTDTFWR